MNTTNLIWSIVLGVFGVVGLWLAGSKNRFGWLLGMLVQVLWFIFAIVTQQYGFILTAVVYGAVYGWNYYKWGRGEKDSKTNQ